MERRNRRKSCLYWFFSHLVGKWEEKPILQTQSVYNYEPWAGIRRQLDNVSGASKEIITKERRELSNKIAKVDPRFPVGTDYKFINANIYVGNTAEYAGYSAEDQKLSEFVSKTAGEIIKDNMRDKGKIFIGDKPSGGFGKLKPGSSLGYTEYN